MLNQEGKHIIVVKGNPGTGKTAVALNLLFLAKNEKFKNNIIDYLKGIKSTCISTDSGVISHPRFEELHRKLSDSFYCT